MINVTAIQKVSARISHGINKSPVVELPYGFAASRFTIRRVCSVK